MSACSCPSCPHASSAECFVDGCKCCSFLAHSRDAPRGIASKPARSKPGVREEIARQKRLHEAEYGWRSDESQTDEKDEAGT